MRPDRDSPWSGPLGHPLMLGMSLQALTPAMRERLDVPADKGVLVTEVVPDSPVQRAGLKPLDVILSVDGNETNSPEQLTDVAGRLKPGTHVTIRYLRDGKPHEAVVHVGSWGGGRLWEFRFRSPGAPSVPGLRLDRKDNELNERIEKMRKDSARRMDELRDRLRRKQRELNELRKKLRERTGPSTQPSRI